VRKLLSSSSFRIAEGPGVEVSTDSPGLRFNAPEISSFGGYVVKCCEATAAPLRLQVVQVPE